MDKSALYQPFSFGPQLSPTMSSGLRIARVAVLGWFGLCPQVDSRLPALCLKKYREWPEGRANSDPRPRVPLHRIDHHLRDRQGDVIEAGGRSGVT